MRLFRVICFAVFGFALSALMATPSLACACCGTYKVVNVKPDDVLNVRSGPSVRYRKIGKLNPDEGCIFKTKTCKRRWCRIEFGETKGWVHTYYLQLIK